MSKEIRNTIFGLPEAGSGGKSWASYWNPLKPLGGETPTYWYKEGTRSGLTLPNSVSPGTGDETINLPRISFGTNEYAIIADNASMDIINNLGTNPLGNDDLGWTMCARINNGDNSKTYDKAFLGKAVYGSAVGRFGITGLATSGYLNCVLQSSGGTISIPSTIDVTTVSWPFVLIDVNYTTKKMRFFVKLTGENLAQIGADTSFTGTLAELSNSYKFYIGAFNAASTGNPSYITPMSCVDLKIFNKILTSSEQTTISNGGYVSGAVNNYPFDGYVDGKLIDVTGGKHLTPTGGTLNWDAYGSRQLLDVGYSRFVKFPSKDIHIAYASQDTPTSYTPTGYTKEGDFVGSLTEFNGANSYVSIAGVDRSHATNSTYIARALTLQQYYRAAQVTWLHSNEMNNKNMANYFANQLLYFKRDSSKIIDIVRYATTKTGADYEKIIKWSAETGVLKFDVIVCDHIVCVKGSKMIKQSADNNTLYLSTNYGATYPVSLDITGVGIITWGLFADNGNIGFCSATKMYYSDDNLATYQESTVLDVNGDPFTSDQPGTFAVSIPAFGEVTTKGVKIYTMVNYVTTGTNEVNNINQWYTKDSFVNWKSGYKFGVSLPNAICRHGHMIEYDSISDRFWMGTGDADSPADTESVKNNIMVGEYNHITDTFTWTIVGTGGAGSIWENAGIGFDDDYYYHLGEGPSATFAGVLRLPRADVANFGTNNVLIFKPEYMATALYADNNLKIMSFLSNAAGDNRIAFSLDGINYRVMAFPELTVGATWGAYYRIGKLDNGYYLFNCSEVGETETMETRSLGHTLLIKPSLIV